MPVRQQPTTAVLLATYNGTRFLNEQIQSLANQSFPRIDVWASDDGSVDGTRDLLLSWAKRWQKGKFEVLRGPERGVSENFRWLLASRAIEADYFAFCDQDDIWDPDKIERAIEALQQVPSDRPALYCSRSRIIDERGIKIGLSPRFSRSPGFQNAIVQNIAGGNTMVLNRSAREAIRKTAAIKDSFGAHDWWCYIVVTAVGGVVKYCSLPRISYRQHSFNLIGHPESLLAQWPRVRHLFEGRFKRSNEANVTALRE